MNSASFCGMWGGNDPMLSLTGCARPAIGCRQWNTYTVLGFLGYFVASMFGAITAITWDFVLAERLVALVAPPLAFIAAVAITTAVKGREQLVFYRGAMAAVVT